MRLPKITELRAPELEYFRLYLLILRLDISMPVAVLAYLSSAVAMSSFSHTVSYAVALAVFLLISANMIVNDLINISYDRVRKPTKAILSRKVSLKLVGAVFIACLLLSFALANAISPAMLEIFILITAIMTLYSWKIKNVMLSEIVVGFLVALIIMSAGTAGNSAFTFFMALMYFFLSIMYMLYKNIEDFMDNRRRDEETLINKIGIFRSRFAAEALTAGMIFSSFLPFIAGVMGSVYLFFALIADIIMLLPMVYPKYSSLAAKASALIIFIAFIFGSMEISLMLTIGV